MARVKETCVVVSNPDSLAHVQLVHLVEIIYAALSRWHAM